MSKSSLQIKTQHKHTKQIIMENVTFHGLSRYIPLCADNEYFRFEASTVSIGGAIIWISIYYLKSRSRRSGKKDCSIPNAPVGFFETVKCMSGSNTPFFMLDMVKRSGSDIYNLPIGFTVVGDPNAVREILLDKSTDKPAKYYAFFVSIAGEGNLFTRRNDEKWKIARKGTAHAFSSMEVGRMNRICSKHSDDWIENTLKPCIDKGEGFDPSKEMCKMTFRVILESAFEYTEATDEEVEYFAHHLEVALKEFAMKHLGAPLRKYYGPLLSEYRIAWNSCLACQAFTKKILDAYRSKANKSTNKTIIRLLVENQAFNDRERVAEMFTFLVAGHDTTGFTLGTVLTLLAKNPDVSDKLHRELSSMEASDRPKSRYLKQVIDESNRLVPVAATASIRVTGRDVSCKGGSMIIPAGTICWMPQIIPNRNPAIFPDPDAFRPERWDTADKVMRDAITMFSLGNRNCIGQSLAVAELYSVLPKILAHYKFDVETDGTFEYFLTLKYHGVRLRPSRVVSSLVN